MNSKGTTSDATAGPDARASPLPGAAFESLRRIAAARLGRLPRGPTLQPTDVLNEAFVRVLESRAAGGNAPVQPDPARDAAVLATTIRSVVVDRIRRREVRRRHAPAVANSREPITPRQSQARSLLAIDESLEVLATIDPRSARLVELHVFAGLAIDHAAVLIGVSVSTAERDWRFAKAWLADRIRTLDSGAKAGNRDGRTPPSA